MILIVDIGKKIWEGLINLMGLDVAFRIHFKVI